MQSVAQVSPCPGWLLLTWAHDKIHILVFGEIFCLPLSQEHFIVDVDNGRTGYGCPYNYPKHLLQVE